MKRAVGLLLIVLAIVLATAGLCGAIALAAAAFAPAYDHFLAPMQKWLAQGLGIDPTDLVYLPGALASVALGMGAVGQQLLGRKPPSQFLQVDVFERTAA